MIESLKLVLHNIPERLTSRLTEVLGWSVTTTAALITGLSIIDLINGILQSIALIVTILGGIATYRYVRKKERALPNNTDHGNERT